jgi:hypothetical protein
MRAGRGAAHGAAVFHVLKRDQQKHALGLDPWVDSGFASDRASGLRSIPELEPEQKSGRIQ